MDNQLDKQLELSDDEKKFFESVISGDINGTVGLLRQGVIADVNLRDRGRCDLGNYGMTALAMASHLGHTEMTKVLIGAEFNADPNIGDDFGWTPLMWACREGHLAVVKLLVRQAKANVDQTEPRNGRTALMKAAYAGRLEICEYLIKFGGAKCNDRDVYGNTALELAIIGKRPKVAEFLRKCGGMQ